jgi:hypothetical protein
MLFPARDERPKVGQANSLGIGRGRKKKVFQAYWRDTVGHRNWLQVKDFINKTLASRGDLAYEKRPM